MSQPRLSILIPNFNNGRQSSKDASRDFIDDLFNSLLHTLVDDPTPLEIIVADDGSTDDSLDTCRRWAEKTWGGHRKDEPFLRLIEREHCGVLSVVANELTREAKGEFCARLDGDIVIRTPRWAAELCRIFDEGSDDLGVVGPKQLALDGSIHSFGSWILHPRGHHHVAQGAATSTATRSIEVDHVMGCFYGHRRRVWEELDGYDESILRGQTVDFGLRARLRGWRTFAVPTIEFVHAHAARIKRANTADTESGIEETLDRFHRKWGFDRLAPDLDEVAERYAGTRLLWNARVFGPALPWPPPGGPGVSVESCAWSRFGADQSFRNAMMARIALTRRVETHTRPLGRTMQVRAGVGLLTHLLALKGVECVGVEAEKDAVDLARAFLDRQRYPGVAPTLAHQPDPRTIPAEDGSFDSVVLFDVLETHPNPVGLLGECWRILRDDGIVVIMTRERRSPLESDLDALHAYRPHELVLQVQGTRCFKPLPVEIDNPVSGSLLVVAERRPHREGAFFTEPLETTSAAAP